MKLYKHKNYMEYVEAQIVKNTKKVQNVWVENSEINLIVNHIKNNIKNPSFGLCHGVRNGWEVSKLKELLNIKVIGTDISPTANEFENVIQWDFHEINKDWDNVDFIYSNSFDHAYDPHKCLDVWMDCIKRKSGICYIHWMKSNLKKIDQADCFSASRLEYRNLFNQKYKVFEEFYKYKERVIFAIKHGDSN